MKTYRIRLDIGFENITTYGVTITDVLEIVKKHKKDYKYAELFVSEMLPDGRSSDKYLFLGERIGNLTLKSIKDTLK